MAEDSGRWLADRRSFASSKSRSSDEENARAKIASSERHIQNNNEAIFALYSKPHVKIGWQHRIEAHNGVADHGVNEPESAIRREHGGASPIVEASRPA